MNGKGACESNRFGAVRDRPSEAQSATITHMPTRQAAPPTVREIRNANRPKSGYVPASGCIFPKATINPAGFSHMLKLGRMLGRC